MASLVAELLLLPRCRFNHNDTIETMLDTVRHGGFGLLQATQAFVSTFDGILPRETLAALPPGTVEGLRDYARGRGLLFIDNAFVSHASVSLLVLFIKALLSVLLPPADMPPPAVERFDQPSPAPFPWLGLAVITMSPVWFNVLAPPPDTPGLARVCVVAATAHARGKLLPIHCEMVRIAEDARRQLMIDSCAAVLHAMGFTPAAPGSLHWVFVRDTAVAPIVAGAPIATHTRAPQPRHPSHPPMMTTATRATRGCTRRRGWATRRPWRRSCKAEETMVTRRRATRTA